ncbi:uncharacterized protein N7518_002550 [Penicillium psychrosexuale]|uniref:uncharacterized protein n=1 Tax=Penicillium psychrosexuale TaxID=1002107 RepID=UPI0025455AD0|nr:uncharacterized protein N7518_002550 [Penicillium psychrosexuale]KAJ5800482.1 hypothetical protein N7518_002550 [Penicillium psychrosexuale]
MSPALAFYYKIAGHRKEAARHVTRLGAERVILSVRNVPVGEKATVDIEKFTGRSGICEVWKVDLSSFELVLTFGNRLVKLLKLDTTILNAVIATMEFSTAEGYK